jgi:hypothetical protein
MKHCGSWLGDHGTGAKQLGLIQDVALTVLGHVVQRLFLDERQDVVKPTSRLLFPRTAVGIADPFISPTAARKELLYPFVVHAAEGKILQMIDALGSPGRFSRRLDGRQQQRDQDADDGNYHQ